MIFIAYASAHFDHVIRVHVIPIHTTGTCFIFNWPTQIYTRGTSITPKLRETQSGLRNFKNYMSYLLQNSAFWASIFILLLLTNCAFLGDIIHVISRFFSAVHACTYTCTCLQFCFMTSYWERKIQLITKSKSMNLFILNFRLHGVVILNKSLFHFLLF